MGSSNSLRQTPLADSIVGKKFKTKGCVSFGYCGHDGKYVICRWEDKNHVLNPKDGSFDLQVLSPIEFIVTEVIEHWGISAGTYITMKGKIISNIPINEIGQVREAINTRWTDSSFHRLRTQHIPAFISKNGETEIMTEDIDFDLYYFHMGLSIPKISSSANFDHNGSITNDNSMLEEII